MTDEELITQIIVLAPQAQKKENVDRAAISTDTDNMVNILKLLRDNPSFQFKMLMDHTCVDWLEEGNFELIYHLYSFDLEKYLIVSVKVPRDKPRLPSVCYLWSVAELQEREVYDLFGIEYLNHPDLRRLFLEDDWVGFPLRKDYKDPFMLELPDHG